MREKGITKFVLQNQIRECLDGMSSEQIKGIIIAYEPIWAIGSSKTATPEIAQEAHHLCRTFIADIWGEGAASQVALLYGGSVKPDNALLLLEQPDIDGLLVGGASLSVDTFSKILHCNQGTHV